MKPGKKPEKLERENTVIFGISDEGTGDSIPVIVFGIPKGAWEYMKDGHTHTFDLNKAGLPVKVILYGAPDHDTAKAWLQIGGKAKSDRTDQDFSIEEKQP